MHRLAHHIPALLALQKIAETRSINSAAQALNMSQSTLSRHIASLEAVLGSSLLLRSHRGVDLSAFGKTVVSHSRAIEYSLDATLADSVALRNVTLKLGAGPLIANYILPDAIEVVQRVYRDLAIRLVEAPRLTLLAQLRAGELDVVVTAFPMDSAEKGIVQKEIFDLEMCVVARKRHPLANDRTKRTLADLASYRWVLPPPTTSFFRTVGREFRKAGLTFPPTMTEASSPEAVRSLVRSTDTIAILPRRSVIDELQAGRFIVFEGDWSFKRRKVGMFLRNGERMSSACQVLLKSLNRLRKV